MDLVALAVEVVDLVVNVPVPAAPALQVARLLKVATKLSAAMAVAVLN